MRSLMQSTSRRRALFLSLTILGVSSCDLVLDVPSGCTVSVGPNADNQDIQVVHEQPNRCPVPVPANVLNVGHQTPFEAMVSAPYVALVDGILYAYIYDDNNSLRQYAYFFFQPDYADPDRERCDIFGSYPAGYAGFSGFGFTTGMDVGVLETATYGGSVVATVELPYKSPPATAISGSTSASEGSSVTMTIAVNQEGVSPFSHEWFLEDYSFGPPSYTSLQVFAGPSGESQLYKVVTTDGSGNTATAYHRLTSFGGPGGCLEPPCP